MMLGEKRRASAGQQATDEAQTQRTIHPSIDGPPDVGNPDDVCLNDLLAKFVALNHDRYFPKTHVTTDTAKPTAHPLWRRARAELSRWLALGTLKSPVFPPFIGNIILESAETWAVETGHYD